MLLIFDGWYLIYWFLVNGKELKKNLILLILEFKKNREKERKGNGLNVKY